jgi:hypothetical protein
MDIPEMDILDFKFRCYGYIGIPILSITIKMDTSEMDILEMD